MAVFPTQNKTSKTLTVKTSAKQTAFPTTLDSNSTTQTTNSKSQAMQIFVKTLTGKTQATQCRVSKLRFRTKRAFLANSSG